MPPAAIDGALRAEYPFEARYLDVGAGSLHYLDEGPRGSDGGALLMLHGNPTWSFYWRNLVQAFRGRYRVIAPKGPTCHLQIEETILQPVAGNHLAHDNFER